MRVLPRHRGYVGRHRPRPSAARGVVYGVLFSIGLFWGPLVIVIAYATSN